MACIIKDLIKYAKLQTVLNSLLRSYSINGANLSTFVYITYIYILMIQTPGITYFCGQNLVPQEILIHVSGNVDACIFKGYL